MAVRGTQSFVRVLGECWSRPSLLALEILWRWLFGVPLLAILAWQGLLIYSAMTSQLAAAGIDRFSMVDPMRAAVIASDVYAVIAPPVFRTALWLAATAIPELSTLSLHGAPSITEGG